METLAYEDARNEIRDGDILAYTGGWLYAALSLGQRLNLRLLQHKATPDYVPAHVGLAYWDADRLMCIEQNIGGGQIVPLSQQLDKYAIVWCPVDPALSRKCIINTARSAIGRPYSFRQAYLAGTQQTVTDKYRFCSGLVQLSLLAGGHNWSDPNPLPVECVYQPCVTHHWRLRPQ